jgi:hypothetical protein
MAPETPPTAETLALFEIKARGYHNGARGILAARLSDCAAIDIPRLVAAVEAVLRDHEPRTPIPPNRHYRICRACSRIWPCATVQDVTRELLGEEYGHG